MDSYSLSYSGESVKTDGQWNDSGSGGAVRDSSYDYSYSGTGSLSSVFDTSSDETVSVHTYDRTANENGEGDVFSHREEGLALEGGTWRVIPMSNTSRAEK